MASSRDEKTRPDLSGDVYRSVVFLTRFPAPPWPAAAGRELAAASWAFPLAGILVATLGGAVYAAATFLAWPPLACALLALAAIAIATGGLHEDGLSDLADGAWGGTTRERRLEIMGDSRIGTYGTIALIVSFGVRAVALAEIGEPEYVLGALVAAAALSRAMMPPAMAMGTPAKPDGLGAGAGSPTLPVWSMAVTIGIVAAALAAPAGWLGASVAAAAGAAVCAWFAARAVGGHTGDTLGATQQVAEMCALAAIAAALAAPLD